MDLNYEILQYYVYKKIIKRKQMKVIYEDCTRLNMPVEYVDERFTSVLAHRTMLEAGLKRKDRQNKALVDEISATIILQSYLENRSFR